MVERGLSVGVLAALNDFGFWLVGDPVCCKEDRSDNSAEAVEADHLQRNGFADDTSLLGRTVTERHEQVLGRHGKHSIFQEGADADGAVDVDAVEDESDSLGSLGSAQMLEARRVADLVSTPMGSRRQPLKLPDGEPTWPEPTNSNCSTSAGSRSGYQSMRSDGLEDRRPTPIDGGLGMYTGQWLGDTRHGAGSVVWSSGQRYDGQFRNDLPHGRGIFIEADGGCYDGRWELGKRHGHGIYRHADGTVYEGLWVNDLKSGSGAEQWTDGARFEGQYSNGLKNGAGIYTADGNEYVGEFHDDRMHGTGRFTFRDGRVYQGEWRHGKMHGEGRMDWPSGAVYEGTFKDGQKSGNGTFTHDGQSYVGQWFAGKKHGKAYSDYGDGNWYQELWQYGEMVDEVDLSSEQL